MKIYAFYFLFILSTLTHAQSFPDPVKLSTGQGIQGALDPIWKISDWYSSPPNPMSIAYGPALISNNCAPGAWVDPTKLPSPINNGNWISAPGFSCVTDTAAGYIAYRLTLNLPASCNGNSIGDPGIYKLNFSGYVDNAVQDVFVNGTSKGLSGGSYSTGSQVNVFLDGPWVPGVNYIDVIVYNITPWSGPNPYGLLFVADMDTPYTVCKSCTFPVDSIPNIFTPNGDDVNDEFYIPGDGLTELACEIFDRWGLKIYEYGSGKEFWNGKTMKGDAASDGTYYYMISAVCNDEKKKVQGFIHLMR